MRRLTIGVFVFFFFASASAQQKPWQPFPFGQVSHFNDSVGNTSNFTKTFYTLSADSMRITGNDTIVYFNRNLFPNEPRCMQPGSSMLDTMGYLLSYLTLRDSFAISGDTMSLFGDDGSGVNDAVPPQRWLFNRGLYEQLNVDLGCASGIYAYDQAWFDAALNDSVRRVSLFSTLSPFPMYVESNMMLVSKWHGLVEWRSLLYNALTFCNGYQELKLAGYVKDTTQWGFEPPPVENYFRYYPGDIIKGGSGNGFPPVQSWRDSITSVTYIPDSLLSYSFHRNQFTVDWDTNYYSEYNSGATFYFDDYKRVFNRTTGLTGIQGSGLTSSYLTIKYDECGLDTVCEFGFFGYDLLDSCSLYVWDVPTPISERYSTRRGFLFYESVFASTFQVAIGAYYSPTKNYECGDWSPLNVEEILNQTIHVSPNPTNDKLTINFHQPVSGTLQIVDAAGRIIYTQQLVSNALVELEVADLSPAVYFIRVLSNNGVYTSKFVKQ